MTDKEKLDLKIKYLLQLNENLSNSKEVFEKLKEENPELLDDRLNEIIYQNDDEQEDVEILR